MPAIWSVVALLRTSASRRSDHRYNHRNHSRAILRFYGTDFAGANLCEVTDGQGRYWLTRDYMLARFAHRPGVELGVDGVLNPSRKIVNPPPLNGKFTAWISVFRPIDPFSFLFAVQLTV